MFKLPTISVVLFVIILSGCGFSSESTSKSTSVPSQAGNLLYPFHLAVSATVPQNNVSSFVGDLWGTVVVDEDGNISGTGTIDYDAAGPCEWEPPSPQDQEPPYCQLTGLTDGSFKITGVVVQWVDGTHPLDASILASAQKQGWSTNRLPRELGLSFVPQQIPTETSDVWGWADLSIQTIQTNGLALALDAAGVFDPFQIYPIILDGTESAEVTKLGSYRFDGSTDVAQGQGTFFFVDQVPEGVTQTGSYVIPESIEAGKKL